MTLELTKFGEQGDVYRLFTRDRQIHNEDYVVLIVDPKDMDETHTEALNIIKTVLSIIWRNVNGSVKEIIRQKRPAYIVGKNPPYYQEFDWLIEKDKEEYLEKTGFAENPKTVGFLNFSNGIPHKLDEDIITHEFGHTLYHFLTDELKAEWDAAHSIYASRDKYKGIWMFKSPSESMANMLQIFLNVTKRKSNSGGVTHKNMDKKVPEYVRVMSKVVSPTNDVREYLEDKKFFKTKKKSDKVGCWCF